MSPSFHDNNIRVLWLRKSRTLKLESETVVIIIVPFLKMFSKQYIILVQLRSNLNKFKNEECTDKKVQQT